MTVRADPGTGPPRFRDHPRRDSPSYPVGSKDRESRIRCRRRVGRVDTHGAEVYEGCRPSDSEAESLIYQLQNQGYVAETTVEQEATSRLATVRLVPPGQTASGVVVDLLFASSGIEPEIVAAADPLEVFPGVTLPVACRGHLIALKTLSRDDRTRPQDVIDLRALLEHASSDDLELARESLGLISARGYHRDRDLAVDLERLLKDFSGH